MSVKVLQIIRSCNLMRGRTVIVFIDLCGALSEQINVAEVGNRF